LCEFLIQSVSQESVANNDYVNVIQNTWLIL
jgi:hypothetical protein